MKYLPLAFAAAVLIIVGCSPSDTYKPASERQYESADPPVDTTQTPDSTASPDEEEDATEEVILRSL